MFKWSAVLTAIYFLLPSFAWAQVELEIMKSRPSYQQIYQPCSANIDDFKLTMYHHVYTDAIMSTLKLSMISSTEISTTVATHGLSPYLDWFLQNDTTIPALSACFKNEKAHHAFIAKLLVAGALGRIVGISISAVSLKYTSRALGKSLAYLKNIAVPSGKYIGLAMTAAGTAFAIQQLRKDMKANANNSDYKTTLDGIGRLGSQLSASARQQIKLIETELQDPNLSVAEHEHLEKDMQDWKIVLESFVSS